MIVSVIQVPLGAEQFAMFVLFLFVGLQYAAPLFLTDHV